MTITTPNDIKTLPTGDQVIMSSQSSNQQGISTMRWVSYESTWEPLNPSTGTPMPSRHWGAACVIFEYADRPLRDGEFEASPEGFIHSEQILKCESDRRNKIRPLFTDDIGCRDWKKKTDQS